MIQPATLRDLTYVAANMRSEDWAEIACQCPSGLEPFDVAAWSLQGREAWVASLKGQPVAAFGVHPATSAGNVLSVWAWGTRRMTRAVPEISRFILNDCAPRWIADGVTRVEARSIETHVTAHRWMRSLSAVDEPLPAWGKGGEDFRLFYWLQKHWRKRMEQ